jgi:phage shock protein A
MHNLPMKRNNTMSIVKRITTTLLSRIDHVVGELENHDALISAAISEQRKKIASAKVQMARLRSNKQELRSQIAQLTLNEKRWAQRAIQEAINDEGKALACIQRRMTIQTELCKLEQMTQEYQRTSEKMSVDIGRCEEELKTMIQKQDLMRARQTSVDAMNVINQMGNGNIDGLQGSFERWESRIIHGEMLAGVLDDSDPLEQIYLSTENEQNLRLELQLLLQKEKNHDNY